LLSDRKSAKYEGGGDVGYGGGGTEAGRWYCGGGDIGGGGVFKHGEGAEQGVATGGVAPVAGRVATVTGGVATVTGGVAAAEERKGARISVSSATLVSEGVGDCWAWQASNKLWKSNR
jgi:hypothetical protein